MCLCFYNISPSSPTWYFHPAQQVRGFREKCKWDLNGLHRCYIIVSPSPPNGLADMWASRSKPKKVLDLHPTAGILLQSLVFFPQRCRDRLLQPSASSGVVLRSSAKRYPADGQAIPPLRTSCYFLPSVGPPRNRTSQVFHSSPSATPLPRLPPLRVVPVWGLTVVHHLGALDAAWSTYESHRKRTVRGEPDGWDPRGPWSHARKVPPY